MTYHLGIDISHYQAYVDFEVAKANGVEFVYVKRSEGTYPDTVFVQHWAGSVGLIKRGAYHYYRDAFDPKGQAQKFFDLVASTGDLGELPPVLDVEEINNPTLTPSKIKLCLETIETLFGRTPIIYTRASVWNPKIGNVAWASHYPLWVAHYPFYNWFPTLIQYVAQWLKPTLPTPWTQWAVWQISSKGPASKYGVTGSSVDLDLAQEDFFLPVPPAPQPGEPIMQFKTKIKYNIRSTPATNIANDVGDIPVGVTIIAQEVRFTDANSSWVRIIPDPAWITKTSTEYWIAGNHDGQGPFLDWVPGPAPATLPPGTLEALQAQLEENTAALVDITGHSHPEQMPVSWWKPSHVVVTSDANGEKLRATPDGTEAVMVKHGTLLMDLGGDWKGYQLFAANRENVPVTGWLEPGEYQKL